MSLHPLAHTPHLAYVRIAQRPIALELIVQIDDTTGFIQETLGGVVSKLGEGFGTGDPSTNRYTSSLKKGRAYVPT